MERLTEQSNGTVWLKSHYGGLPLNLEPHEIYVAVEGTSYIRRILQRLAAYEDTGLTPEGIKELQADYAELSNRTYGPLHHEIAEWVKADEAGRLVVLPEVPEGDRQAFVDGLHDYFQEASNYDPSVGIFGMREGEAELAKALMDALNRQEAKDDSQ